ncbi:hypothetical protein N7516_010881 [Penicillium verrucosum]|uniref:uncharacterized protein n=1 Tax=Penicillium verrucosum TaxID=60171 RepID=UPI0025451742|nr:uncharacterized protein N7516_010881 [Penicillium verrucosum]KAJ5920023.1 hypothetical protein N7516_010881 [Penicillium verrucosum]
MSGLAHETCEVEVKLMLFEDAVEHCDTILPPPPPLLSTQSSPSHSASGTSRSIGQQLVASQGFWGLMIVAAVFLAAGAGYLLWKRPASEGEDYEDASPKDVTVGEQPKGTREEITEGDDVEAQTPKTPKTPPRPPPHPRRRTRGWAPQKSPASVPWSATPPMV